jgi:hypothetical protein
MTSHSGRWTLRTEYEWSGTPFDVTLHQEGTESRLKISSTNELNKIKIHNNARFDQEYVIQNLDQNNWLHATIRRGADNFLNARKVVVYLKV